MSRPLLIISVVVFVDLLGFGMIIPLISLYGKHFEASTLELAVLGAVYSSMQFIFAPFWGRLSDRHGRRPILLCSLLGSTISYLLFGLAHSLTILVVSRAFAGIFAANIATAHAAAADLSDDKSRTAAMGILGAAFGLGFTVGPVLGGLGAKFLGLAWPGYLASLLCGINLLAAYRYLPETKLCPKDSEPDSLSAGEGIGKQNSEPEPTLGYSPLYVLFTIFFLTVFAFAHMEHVFSLFLKQQLHLQTAEAGWLTGKLMFSMGLVGIFVQGGFVRRVGHKIPPTHLLMLGSLTTSVGMICFSQAGSELYFFISAVIIAAGISLVNPSISSLISLNAAKNRQGATFGTSQSLGSLARALGPFTGLSLFAFVPRAPLYLAACIFLVVLAIVLYRTTLLGTNFVCSQKKLSQPS